MGFEVDVSMTTAPPVSCGPNVSVSKFITVSPVGLLSSGVISPNNGADYGPDTPGTQTSGIQEAVNAANGGGFVLLLPGTFTLFPGPTFGTLQLSGHHDIFISGCGEGVTILDVTNSIGNGFPGITIAGDTSYLTLKGFTMTDSSTIAEIGILLKPYILIGSAILFPPTDHVSFDRLEFASKASTGPRGSISGVYIQLNNPTSEPSSVDHWTVDRCTFTYPPPPSIGSVTFTGIGAAGTGPFSVSYFRFENNTVDGPWPSGSFLTASPTWVVPQCTWKNNIGTDLGFSIVTPPLPAVGTPVPNPSPWRVRVYISVTARLTETITDVKGVPFTLPTTEAQFQLEPGESITLGGVLPPTATWKWYGID